MNHLTHRRHPAQRTVRGRTQRKNTVTVSVLCSVIVHGVLLGGSMLVYIQGEKYLGKKAAQLFNVQMSETSPAPKQVRPAPKPDPSAIQSIEEILQQESVLNPPSFPVPPTADPSRSSEIEEKSRVDYVPRESVSEISAETAGAVDLKVVALANKAFSENIGPRRRTMSQGGGVVLPAGSLPGWSGPVTVEAREDERKAIVRAKKSVDDAERQAENATREKVDREDSLPGGLLASGERSVPEVVAPVTLLPVLEDTETVRKYDSLDDLLDIDLRVYRRPDDPLGYFEVRIGARGEGRLPVLAKDIVFVIDSSKSTGPTKLEEAQAAVRDCLLELNRYDRFNVVAFKREPAFFSENLVAATPDNTSRAERFVRQLTAGGETDVYSALLPLVQKETRPNVPYILFLFSDGKSTVGTLGSRDIINQLTEANRNGANASIYAFGGGSSINRYLLDLLALRNKGTSETTRVVNRIDEDMPAFYGRLRDPLLTNLSAKYSGIKLDEVYPDRMPDFYLGREVTVLGRFGDEKEFSMRITGFVGGTRKELVFRRRFDEAVKANEDIALRWATRKAYNIIEQICAHGSDSELERQLDLINRRYGVRTAYDQRVQR